MKHWTDDEFEDWLLGEYPVLGIERLALLPNRIELTLTAFCDGGERFTTSFDNARLTLLDASGADQESLELPWEVIGAAHRKGDGNRHAFTVRMDGLELAFEASWPVRECSPPLAG